MTLALRIGILSLAMGVVSAGCIGIEPSGGATPTRGPVTATATEGPSPTPTVPLPTATATSTTTPTATATGTPTATPLSFTGLQIDPVTGQVVVPTPIGGTPFFPSAPPPAAAGGGVPAGSAPVAPAPTTPDASPVWGCDGDERMEFLPPNPQAGEKAFVFVTGRRNRQFGLMIGPELSGVQGQDVAGGTGLRKRWEFTPARSGSFTYHFYGGPYPEHLCVSSTVNVGGPQPAGAPRVGPTNTPVRPPLASGSPRPDH